MVTEAEVMTALRPVQDPEIGVSIVDLGLIYGVDVLEGGTKLNIRMTLTSPMCPSAPEIISMVEAAADRFDDVEEVKVEMVWDPPWDPRTMATDDAKDLLGIW
jgi:metal-sulfur cluster biosynthetic enzyme